MSRLDLISLSVHDDSVSAVVQNGRPNDLVTAIALAVVIMLMGFALQALKDLLGEFWSMVRVMFSALGVALLVFASLALIVGVLIVQLRWL
jgi:hypothetical protein